MISFITFAVCIIIVLIQFRNKTIYPQNLENLGNIFEKVHSEYGINHFQINSFPNFQIKKDSHPQNSATSLLNSVRLPSLF